MIGHDDLTDQGLRAQIKRRQITFAGHAKLKIYGRLNCWSGKRMLRSNRVFFASEQEALGFGYRPCGHCMKKAYSVWKTTRSP